MNPELKETVTPEQISTMLAFYYKEPLFIEYANGKILNPRVRDVAHWFSENFETEKGMLQMVEKVKANFNVTSDHPFPTIKHLNDIFWMMDISPHHSPYRDTRGATIDGALIEFSRTNQITYEPPEETKDVPLDVRCRDEWKLSFNDMLRKYGIRLTFEAVKFNCQHCAHERWITCIHPAKDKCASSKADYVPEDVA